MSSIFSKGPLKIPSPNSTTVTQRENVNLYYGYVEKDLKNQGATRIFEKFSLVLNVALDELECILAFEKFNLCRRFSYA